ncbi:iron ABC transporter permease [Kordiimonas sp. SCSIO 12610]|uniref:FecCD family ABC transporter permease n=1 Tax=Kordiimonas sp. SCSIO 12610 TaxID=2829597 RepID=UPI00210D2871|nr:iron ABC transporter permease [Kordiimonas sp. SCSIO 12610]UTW55929.1 iron ABC transporter permease [Kordiimonas sp. SCSIO 12610]
MIQLIIDGFRLKQTHLLIVLSIVLIVTGLISATFGQAPLSFSQVIEGLMGPSESALSIIIRELRLPRILLGMLVGAALGFSGAALQGLLRNPLAEPGVIGVTASASLGAVIAIYFGLTALTSFAVPIFAMLGAFAATMVVLLVASRDASVLTLILTGIGLSSLSTALISLVMNFAPNPMSLRDMVLWMLGSLENRTTDDLFLAAPFIILGWILMIGVGQGLNALALGEDAATSLGINLKRLRWRIIAGTALSVGAAVSVCGGIGFVGLVVPHIVRFFVGSEPRQILLPSAIAGAVLLTLADIVTRLPFGAGQLQLGVVTAFIGAPVFLVIVYKTRETMR